jgi:hypothetical protein
MPRPQTLALAAVLGKVRRAGFRKTADCRR